MITIYASAGATEYVTVDITETRGQTIASDPCYLSLGTTKTPGAWTAALVTGAGASMTAKLLVPASTTPGQYWLWLKLTDSPEVPIRRLDPVLVA